MKLLGMNEEIKPAKSVAFYIAVYEIFSDLQKQKNA